MLMNVGPTHDGRIAPILAERLEQMGECVTVASLLWYTVSSLCVCVCLCVCCVVSHRDVAKDQW